jgi:hypothetical protein
MSKLYIKLFILTFYILCTSCSFDEGSSPITQDIEGIWSLNFSDLDIKELNLNIAQRNNSKWNNTFTATLLGLYSPSILLLSDTTIHEPDGYIFGNIKDSALTLKFSNGSSIDGRIWRPTMSWTLVQLKGTIIWHSSNGQILTGNWTTEPRETGSHP